MINTRSYDYFIILTKDKTVKYSWVSE